MMLKAPVVRRLVSSNQTLDQNIMTKIQDSKLFSHLSLKGVCKSHEDVWTTMKAFADDYAEFTDMLDGIQELATAQAEPTTGITQDKRHLRRAMAKAAMAIAGPVAAYAAKAENRELLAKVDFRLSALLGGRDKTSRDRCQAVQTAAVAVLKQLGDYNITAAVLKALQDKIDAYEEILTKPREARASAKTVTRMLAEAFDEVDALVEERMDKLIEAFRAKNPEFVSDYENARRIVVAGASRKTKSLPATGGPSTDGKAPASAKP